MKSTGACSLNELQWLDLKVRDQDNSPNTGHQDDISYFSQFHANCTIFGNFGCAYSHVSAYHNFELCIL